MEHTAKTKMLNLALILSSFIGYLQWGNGRHMFLIEGEMDIFQRLFSDPMSVLHPFIQLPMVGQILLAITLFQKKPARWLSFLGMGLLSLLMLLVFLIGCMSLGKGPWELLSALPFLVVAVLTILHHRKRPAAG